MVTITLEVAYLERGQQKSTTITASAKTYQEAYAKVRRLAEEFVENAVTVSTSPFTVKSIVYS